MPSHMHIRASMVVKGTWTSKKIWKLIENVWQEVVKMTVEENMPCKKQTNKEKKQTTG